MHTMVMMNDGGGGYSGSKTDVIFNLNNAISKLEEIDLNAVKNMIKLDDSDSSTSTMTTAITKRIAELKKLKKRFTDDSNKIETVRNRFNI